RQRRGPALVHAQVTRPYSHSQSDDHAKYRTKEELEGEKRRACIPPFADSLIRDGVATAEELEGLRAAVDAELERAAQAALEAPRPTPEDAGKPLWSADIDPTSDRFATEP